MKNIRMTLQYDGARYAGWTRPETDGFEKTVSGRITAVLGRMTGEEIRLSAGAKTEPGVHALAQTVSFETSSALSPDELRFGLNHYLPQDIAVLSCEEAPERFRADLNARSRTYEYRICTARVCDPFRAPYCAHLYPAPDTEAMEAASELLLGTHDFSGFSGENRKKSKKKKTQKEVLELRTAPDPEFSDLLLITLTADDFLRQMPSRIIGTLLEAGAHLRSPESVRGILDGQEKAEALCDPRGLLLRCVSYSSEP